MQPANTPDRASRSTASVEGNTWKRRRDRRGFARIAHVAGGILQPDDAVAEGGEQALDQRDVPGQPGLRWKVIEVERDRVGRGRREDRFDIGDKTVVGHAFVIEGRQHQRAREAELGGVARQSHGIGDRRRAGSDHHAIERQAGSTVGGHQALALLERERRGLAGGAEHVEPVAAIAEQEAGECGGAIAIGLAVFVDRGCDGGNDALQFAVMMLLEAGRRIRRQGRTSPLFPIR